MTSPKRIVISSDHAGYALKNWLKDQVKDGSVDWIDVGTHADVSVDYPEFGYRVVMTIVDGEADMGIAICGSGIGMSMAVNRHPGIRGALCGTDEMAKLARAHNDANVLCLGARSTDQAAALAIVKTFLSTPFEGGRHERRVAMLSPVDDHHHDHDHGHGGGCCGGGCH